MSRLQMKMKIAIGADHAGYQLKDKLSVFLQSAGYEVMNFGTNNADSCDYADFAHPLALAVETGTFDFGILICGTANGMLMTANKHQGIRAGLAWNEEVASLIRQHNNANILGIPARFVSDETAIDMVKVFLKTPFEGGRHQKRLEKIPC
jgi:ribose 5-phosphate isomerase B